MKPMAFRDSSAIVAERHAKNEVKLREVAEENLQENLLHRYVNLIRKSQEAWELGEPLVAKELLEQAIPNLGEKDVRDPSWYFLWAMVTPDPSRLELGNPARSIAFSEDDSLLAAGGEDG